MKLFRLPLKYRAHSWRKTKISKHLYFVIKKCTRKSEKKSGKMIKLSVSKRKSREGVLKFIKISLKKLKLWDSNAQVWKRPLHNFPHFFALKTVRPHVRESYVISSLFYRVYWLEELIWNKLFFFSFLYWKNWKNYKIPFLITKSGQNSKSI